LQRKSPVASQGSGAERGVKIGVIFGKGAAMHLLGTIDLGSAKDYSLKRRGTDRVLALKADDRIVGERRAS